MVSTGDYTKAIHTSPCGKNVLQDSTRQDDQNKTNAHCGDLEPNLDRQIQLEEAIE